MTIQDMTLCLFMSPIPYHRGGWRMPGNRSGEVTTLSFVADIALAAERAGLDAIFLGDRLTVEPAEATDPYISKFEPVTTLSALAAVTKHIGLAGTISTSFTEPFNVARYLASLDHLSGGRAAWNIVTSVSGNGNFTQPLGGHSERYAVAEEYLEVVTALWDSWADDAITNDVESGRWGRPERIHRVDFQGKYFRVAGPLNAPRPPQGWPVLVQAGSSAEGIEFASKWAELVFTAQNGLEDARRFYQTLKSSAERRGRGADHVRILPGILPIIGETEQAAREIAAMLAERIDVEAGRQSLSSFLADVDLSGLALDEPIPTDILPRPEDVEGGRSRYGLFYAMAHREGYTLRQLIYERVIASGHLVVVGTPQQVADKMEEWFRAGACDGFNIEVSHLGAGLDALTDGLIPELRARGLFRTHYTEGGTLRGNLGLPRPAGRRASYG